MRIREKVNEDGGEKRERERWGTCGHTHTKKKLQERKKVKKFGSMQFARRHPTLSRDRKKVCLVAKSEERERERRG